MSQIRVALDFCLSPRLPIVLKHLYGEHGFRFLHLKDLGIAGSTPDPSWADKYKQFGGRVVLSGDTRIATTPHLARAFIDNGLISFFPGEAYANLKIHAQVALMVYWWPTIAIKIAEALQDHAGVCWRIPCVARRNEIRLQEVPLQLLEIPSAVLAEEKHEVNERG